ncbi:MAG: SDR family oxidoreductase [Gemmatimonadota bacterium]|nr:SDR family oxidoreductase [Gemmatimonadota bacterium]
MSAGRDADRLSALAHETGAAAFPADATDFEAVDGVVHETVERYGRLDGVVNCVGSLLLKPAHLTTYEEFSSTVTTNLTSSFAAATYGSWGIRVNAISPGLTETPLTARITGNEKAKASSEAMHALGRIGQPGDVASAIEWILSDRASWVTGQVVGVDGGLGRVRSA